MPTIDPKVVLRSAAALDRYGPDFRYGHYLAIKRLPMAAGLVGGSGAIIALAQLPPTRICCSSSKIRVRADAEQREKAWFKVRFVGARAGARG